MSAATATTTAVTAPEKDASTCDKRNPADINPSVPSDFTSSAAHFEVGELNVSVRVLKMVNSTFLFVSSSKPECVDEMAVAMYRSINSNSVDDDEEVGESIGITLVGEDCSDSQRLATQLSKRYKRQFYVSFNIKVDRITAPLLERHLMEYIRNNESEFI